MILEPQRWLQLKSGADDSASISVGMAGDKGFRRVALGGYPPRAPTDPCLRINAHGSSSHPYATLATLGRHVDTAPGLDGPAVFPSQAA